MDEWVSGWADGWESWMTAIEKARLLNQWVDEWMGGEKAGLQQSKKLGY